MRASSAAVTASRTGSSSIRSSTSWKKPRAEAERLVVRGFFQDVLDRIELEPVRDAVTAALEARIPQV